MFIAYQALAEDFPTIILSFIVYAVVVLIYARWLRHLFGKRAQRFGWLLLAGQLLLLTMHGWPIGPHEWWDHDSEYNIPVTFATFQVMAGSFLALAIASLSSLRPHWQRGYWALLALGLYVLGQDEFGILHERFPILEELYLFGGILVALLSVVIWRSQDAVKRRYLNLIFTGLGVSVIGAEVLDKLEKTCWSDLSDILISCVRYHPLEESFEKLGAFFVVMALLGFTEHTIPSLKFRRTGWPLLVVFSIIAILQLGQIRALQGRMDFYYQFESNPFKHRLDTEFQNGYQLIGVSLRHTATFNKSMFHQFNIYGKVNSSIKSDFGYALHFVDQASEDVYTAHEHWSRRNANHWLPERIYKEDQHIWVPDDVPLNRALWLVFSLWQQTEVDEFMVIPINASSDHQISNTQIVLHEFVIPAEQGIDLPENALDYHFSNGFALRGAQIPDSAHLGETLVIPMTWETTADGEEDWVQFLHFVHEETGALWNHDQQPLGARLPTRLWYEGMLDSETWQFTLPAELPPGRYAIYTGLYRLSDLARLPVSDADGMPLPDARVPMGSIAISG